MFGGGVAFCWKAEKLWNLMSDRTHHKRGARQQTCSVPPSLTSRSWMNQDNRKRAFGGRRGNPGLVFQGVFFFLLHKRFESFRWKAGTSLSKETKPWLLSNGPWPTILLSFKWSINRQLMVSCAGLCLYIGWKKDVKALFVVSSCARAELNWEAFACSSVRTAHAGGVLTRLQSPYGRWMAFLWLLWALDQL